MLELYMDSLRDLLVPAAPGAQDDGKLTLRQGPGSAAGGGRGGRGRMGREETRGREVEGVMKGEGRGRRYVRQ